MGKENVFRVHFVGMVDTVCLRLQWHPAMVKIEFLVVATTDNMGRVRCCLGGCCLCQPLYVG